MDFYSKMYIKNWLHTYRFESLLVALLMVIFNKIFFFDTVFYTKYVWPANMVLLGVVSMGIFKERNDKVKIIKNILFFAIIFVPFAAKTIFSNQKIAFLALLSYIGFYGIVFWEVMRQIIKRDEITESVIFGSLSGFLLLIIIATFSFLMIDFIDANSFNNIYGNSIPEKYMQIKYFNTITLTTIGYGDITPKSDNCRLLAAFWGVVSQFYMVAVVGIIISKFTSK